MLQIFVFVSSLYQSNENSPIHEITVFDQKSINSGTYAASHPVSPTETKKYE